MNFTNVEDIYDYYCSYDRKLSLGGDKPPKYFNSPP